MNVCAMNAVCNCDECRRLIAAPRTDFADREPAPHDEFTVLRARAELSTAQRDAALDTVAALLDVLQRQGGYMEHRDQVTLRSAEALLVEHGYAKEPKARRASHGDTP